MRISVVCAALALLALGIESHAGAVTWTRFDNSTKPFNGWWPAVVRRNIGYTTDLIDVYTVSNDGGQTPMVTKLSVDSENFPDGNPLDTTDLGGSTLQPPSAVGWGTHQEVFVLGTDRRLWHNWNDGNGWFGWVPLGNPIGVSLCSPPSAVSWTNSSARIDVFIVGCNNVLYHTWADNSAWQGWESLGGTFTAGRPWATSFQPDRIDVMVADQNWPFHLRDKNWDGTRWNLTDTGMVHPHPSLLGGWSLAGEKLTGFAMSTGQPVAWAEESHSCGAFAFYPPLPITFPNFTPPVPISDETVGITEVYFNDNSTHFIQRVGYQQHFNCTQGNWVLTTNNLAGVAFAGVPNGVAPDDIEGGIFVFAVKSDGTLWGAHDTDE